LYNVTSTLATVIITTIGFEGVYQSIIDTFMCGCFDFGPLGELRRSELEWVKRTSFQGAARFPCRSRSREFPHFYRVEIVDRRCVRACRTSTRERERVNDGCKGEIAEESWWLQRPAPQDTRVMARGERNGRSIQQQAVPALEELWWKELDRRLRARHRFYRRGGGQGPSDSPRTF
jgi:hypothetical protein